MLKYVLFDLDDTLYPRSAGLMEAVRGRILRYMTERLGLAPDEAEALRVDYLRKYGTSLRGLQMEREVDAEDYLAFVHDLELARFLASDRELIQAMRDVPLPKVIFTSSTREHSQRVLQQLGLYGEVEHIFDIRTVEYQSKPHPEAYRRVLDLLSVAGGECVFVDDSVANLQAAKKAGMITILVDEVGKAQTPEGIDYRVQSARQACERINRLVEEVHGEE